MNTSNILIVGLCACTFLSCKDAEPPAPILPVPTPEQVAWQKMENYAFVHFGLNTFNDLEWGYGNTPAGTFNPTDLDCEQWVRIIKAAGLKGVILTAKHHDGFCLWPTKTVDYNISNSPYKDGKGDMVRELSDACKKYGLKFGLYLSPWDRHNAEYGREGYQKTYHEQINELISNYGPLFEFWFDGANGGNGWYGGADESRSINPKEYYGYETAREMIKSKHPDAMIFGGTVPDIRWIGNESGWAGETNWSAYLYDKEEHYSQAQWGMKDGDKWLPGECDVSIRPGWFYHPEEDDRVKTVDQLTDLYYRSVGHNATLLLNFPVDRDGLIHPIDSANAVNFHKNVQKQLAHNLLAGIQPKVSDERGGKFSAKAATDESWDTYWATNDGVTAAEIEFDFPKTEKVNRMMIQEYIPLGQRVKSFVVEYDKDGKWLPVKLNEETTTVGYKRLLRFETISTDKLRIRFTDARACLCINNIEAYYAGETPDTFTVEAKELKSYPFTLVGVSEEETKKCMDKDKSTTAFVEGDALVIDLGEERTITSFHYLPDQSEYNKGLISSYELSVGTEANAVNQIVAKGEFSNIKNNPILQSVYFTPVKARYLSLKPTKMVTEGETMGFAEIGIQ